MAIEPTTNAAPDAGQGRNNLPAVGFMLIAALGYSMTPIIVALAGGNNPFLFNAVWRLGMLLGFLAFISWYREVFKHAEVRLLVRSRLKSPAIGAAVVSNFDYALFVMATGFIDVTAATIIFETWPLWMVLVLAWIYRKEARYRRTIGWTASMIVLCLVGLIFVSAGQVDLGTSVFQDNDQDDLILGSILALLGALAGSMAAFSFKWGTDLSSAMSGLLNETGHKRSQKSLEPLCLVMAYGISSSISVLSSALIGLANQEVMNFKMQLLTVTGAMLTYAPATIAWRMGNLRSTDLGINALVYGTPVLSLTWFYLLSVISLPWLDSLDVFNIESVAYLLIGAAAIIAANLLIHAGPAVRRRLGYLKQNPGNGDGSGDGNTPSRTG